jgi:hypothetical protein
MQTTPPTERPPQPPTDDDAPDSVLTYRLGNAALILLGLAGLTALCYSVVAESAVLRNLIMYGVAAPLIARTGLSLLRGIRRRPPTRDAAIIADGSFEQDERQRVLSAKAGSLAGAVALSFPLISGLFLTAVADAAGVTIDTSPEWLALGSAVAFGTLLTHTVANIVAARYYSRRW